MSARATQHQVSSMVTASSSGSKVQRAMYSTGSILFSGEDGEDKQHKPLSADELVPDDFFDFDVESPQEFLDVASAMASGEKFDEHCEEMLSTGLETLTTSKQGMSMDEVLKQDAIQKESYDRPQAPSGGETTLPLAEEGTFKETGDIHSRILAHSKEGGPSTADQLASHFGIVGKFNQTELVNTYLLGAEDLNTTMPRNFLQSKEDEEFQSQFLPQTSSELQRPCVHMYMYMFMYMCLSTYHSLCPCLPSLTLTPSPLIHNDYYYAGTCRGVATVRAKSSVRA